MGSQQKQRPNSAIKNNDTYGLGHKLTLTRNNNNDVLSKAAAPAVIEAKNVLSCIEWYVPHDMPSREQEATSKKI